MNAMSNAITSFEAQIDNPQIVEKMKRALPPHISIDKFVRTLMAAVKADPELLRADRASLLNACEKAALDGLLPDKREAALVIFKRRYKDASGQWQTALEVVYMPMVYGLRKKILQSGEVTDIATQVVYAVEVEEGRFIYEEGTEAMLRHKPKLDISEDDARDEKIVAAYSMATYKDGTKSYEVMRRFEIDRVRECSQTGATKDRYGKPRQPSGPWVEWYPEQAKKTVMRRHSKTLPMSSDIIDVEGRELESARSMAAMLAVEPDAPVTLPRGNSVQAIADQSGTESGVPIGEQTVDQETGEVIAARTDSRGMTEVDEETARSLDAGDGDDDGEGDGEGEESQGEETASSGEADPYAGEPFAEQRKRLMGLIQNAESADDLEYANSEVGQHYASLPGPVQDELDTAIIKKRRTL